MKKSEISKKFNDRLTEALAEGFAPCMTELRGSYSGVFGTQLVLAKGNERIVMWMEESHDYSDRNVPDSVNLFVARFALAKGETTEWNYMWPDTWKKHLVDHQVVYAVSERRDGWYVTDEDEALRAKAIRRSRYGLRRGHSSSREVEVTDRLLAIVRRHRGFKTIKRENLRVVKSRNCWILTNKLSGREAYIGH